MSIQINKLKCVGCGKCVKACPGNLIKKDTDGKADMDGDFAGRNS